MKTWIIPTPVLLAACERGVPENARIVVSGDSVFSWNRTGNAAVADQLAAQLGEPVADVSFPFAQVAGRRGALNIPSQLEGLHVDWVVLNGGANDLNANCGCSDCGPTLDRLISVDGTSGAIPALVADLRGRGSQVIWADYYTSPRFSGSSCEAPYQLLEDRLARMANADTGVTLVDMDDVFRPDDLSLFAADRTHPSEAGSARIAWLVAAALARAEE